MSGECYVPGCDDQPVSRLKYRDSMGDICTEARCPMCAMKLRESDRTSILDEAILVDGIESEDDYYQLTEQEREFIRRLTDGPFSQFAA